MIYEGAKESTAPVDGDVQEAQIPDRVSGEGEAHSDLALTEESDRGQHITSCTHK